MNVSYLIQLPTFHFAGIVPVDRYWTGVGIGLAIGGGVGAVAILIIALLVK